MREPLPRTSVVSGVLSGLSVLASALLLELGRNLVMNSFGDSAEVQLVASGLRWLAVLLVVLALLYTGFRLTAERRDRRRLQRRRELLADLDGPPLTGPSAPQPLPSSPALGGEPDIEPDPALGDHPVAAALHALPVTEYDAATVHAILTAVGMESAVVPDAAGEQPIVSDERWTATGLLAQLISDGVLVCHQTQRYRLVRYPAVPDRRTVIAGAVWQAALFALLRHSADRAASWAIGITTVPFGPRARRWFAVEEPRLRALVRQCCRGDFAAAIPPATAAQLVRIGDALGTWYAVGPADNSEIRSVAEDLIELGPAALGGHHRAIALRAGTAGEPPPWRWRPWWRRATGFGARAEHAAGLALLDSADSPETLAAAVDRLRAAWWRLPREDLANQVRVLADLAVAHIHQGRLDAAQDRLELAALRAREDENADGWARVHEIAGAVAWARGEPRSALRCWQRALTVYRELADDNGIGRCLQHLGAAVLVAPEHGDLVLDIDPADDVAEVLRWAHSWLAEAGRRNPDAAHVGYYTDHAATIRDTAEPPDFERWPLEAREETDQP
ncbi:tetratricopeptide repeat protein [Nocardia sp. NPDC004568]|uniref:tetratricopeptide repeat protein n=1 Tax=Nocardia sp. NPDC004568 TaxID=3154551 RepID=UPI0033BA4646